MTRFASGTRARGPASKLDAIRVGQTCRGGSEVMKRITGLLAGAMLGLTFMSGAHAALAQAPTTKAGAPCGAIQHGDHGLDLPRRGCCVLVELPTRCHLCVPGDVLCAGKQDRRQDHIGRWTRPVTTVNGASGPRGCREYGDSWKQSVCRVGWAGQEAPSRRIAEAPWVGDIEALEGPMKAAIASRVAVGVLSVLALAAFAGGAEAQGKQERGPDAVAPNLKRRPEPLPPSPRPESQAPQEDGPSASDEPPPQGRGCRTRDASSS